MIKSFNAVRRDLFSLNLLQYLINAPPLDPGDFTFLQLQLFFVCINLGVVKVAPDSISLVAECKRANSLQGQLDAKLLVEFTLRGYVVVFTRRNNPASHQVIVRRAVVFC